MAYGIYAKPVGPGPAAPAEIFIDSGLTFPQTVSSVDGQFSVPNRVQYHDFSFSGWDGGGTPIALPTRDIVWDYLPPTGLIPSIYGVTSISFPNTSTLRSFYNFEGASYHREGWNIYKIWPQSNQSYGVTFSNSANFFSISDSGVVCQCIYAYSGNVSSAFAIPAISGFDMSKAIVFANWSHDSVVVTCENEYNSSTFNRKVIRVYRDAYSRANTDNVPTIKMNILVFASGSSVPEHNGGFNIYSPDGKTCVFSTYRTPFALRRFFPSSGGNTGLTKPMLCMTNGVGAIAEQGGGWQWQHIRGYKMSGSTVSSGFGPLVTQWTDQYDGKQNYVINISLPMLDASDYFATP